MRNTWRVRSQKKTHDYNGGGNTELRNKEVEINSNSIEWNAKTISRPFFGEKTCQRFSNVPEEQLSNSAFPGSSMHSKAILKYYLQMRIQYPSTSPRGFSNTIICWCLKWAMGGDSQIIHATFTLMRKRLSSERSWSILGEYFHKLGGRSI